VELLDVTVTDEPTRRTLTLEPARGYSVPVAALGIAARIWDKRTVESPYVHGRAVVGQQLSPFTWSYLPVLVEAASSVALLLRTAQLVDVLAVGSLDMVFRHSGAETARELDCTTSRVALIDDHRAVVHVQVTVDLRAVVEELRAAGAAALATVLTPRFDRGAMWRERALQRLLEAS
jgi:hypothetical protein